MATNRHRLLMELELLDMEEEEAVLMHFNRRQQQTRRRRRRWSVRPLNQSRPTTGEYVSLVRPLRDVDKEKHFAYFRMSAGRFNDLLVVWNHTFGTRAHTTCRLMPPRDWLTLMASGVVMDLVASDASSAGSAPIK